MADAATTILQFVKPEVAASADTWGSKLNADLDRLDATANAITTTGSGAAYVVTTGSSLASYQTGLALLIKASFTCNAAATVNVDTLGAKNITKNGATATVSGDVISGNVYFLVYDGTQFQIVAGPLGISPYQPLDATLTALAALAWSSGNQFPYFTAADTLSLGTITANGLTLVGHTFAQMLTDLGFTANAVTLIGHTFAQMTADLSAMVGDSGSGGTKGLAPAPSAGDAAANKYLKADGTWAAAGGTAAVQSDQETATSTTTYVSPGVQQFHPSAAKCWAYVTVSGGVPTLAASYNITSITDTNIGRLTITIATDFSSANWSPQCSINGSAVAFCVGTSSQAAGSIEVDGFSLASGFAAADPTSYGFAGFGDQ